MKINDLQVLADLVMDSEPGIPAGMKSNNKAVGAYDLEACIQAVKLNQNDAVAHNNLGVALRNQGRLDDAVRCYQKAIELDPKLAAAHNNLGVVLEDQGRLDDAVRCYQKAIELDPKYAVAHYNLGVVLEKQGKRDDAMKHFQTAAHLGNKDAEIRRLNNVITQLNSEKSRLASENAQLTRDKNQLSAEKKKLDNYLASLTEAHKKMQELYAKAEEKVPADLNGAVDYYEKARKELQDHQDKFPDNKYAPFDVMIGLITRRIGDAYYCMARKADETGDTNRFEYYRKALEAYEKAICDAETMARVNDCMVQLGVGQPLPSQLLR